MMKKRKLFLGLAVTALATIALASCTSGSKKSTTSTTPEQPTTVTTTTPQPTVPTTTKAPTTTPAPTQTQKPTTPAPTTTVVPTTPAPTTTQVPTTTIVQQENPIEMNGVAYDTIKAAIAAIPTSGDTSTYTIRLNKGTYNENGLAYNGSATIKIAGNTNAKYGADVIIKGHGSAMPGEQGSSTKTRCLISIQGTGNIILENLTLESDWSRSATTSDVQAEVLGTDTTGNTAAYNCAFKSHQDTLRTAGKAWFYGCYVEGDVDFLWMESGGKVALYEECEIVSVYDSFAKTHNTYITAPRMAETVKVGKGLVIYNSVVRETEEAKENGQLTYLARTPWSSGYYNQVAYINTECSDIEVTDGPWYKNQIETDYDKTTVGWKMDAATAASIGIEGDVDYIVDDATVATEYNGRRSIINRFFDTGKLRYVADGASNWDIDALIAENGWKVTKDESSVTLPNETMGEAVVYAFDGSVDQSAMCDGFAVESGKPHYRGQAGATITVPVSGKCYVEVYGYYAGTALATAEGQGEAVMFFNNGSTSAEVENDYIVYNENAKSVTITAAATTYITKIVVVSDTSIEYKAVEDLTISVSSPLEMVGVPVTFSAAVTPKGVTNGSVRWSSSNTEVATIDEYTGKVKFIAAGEVTFTVTACDGSGVEKTVTCNPTSPTWTQIEWYTSDKEITAEEGALNIDMFDVNNSAYKALGKEYTVTNLAGDTITTTNGLKLNSQGKLSFATLKYAEVTLIVAPAKEDLAVAPVITTSDGAQAVLLSQSVDETTGLQTFKYALEATGLWSIERGDTARENNPLVYVLVEYKKPVISEEMGLSFKGGSYTTNSTGVQNVTNAGYIDAADRTVEINKVSITNTVSNDTAGTNWLKFNAGAKIEFNVAKACTVVVAYYQKEQTVMADGVAIESSINAKGLYEYEIPAAATVTIESSVNDYIGFVGVMFKSLDQRKTESIAKLEKAYPAKNYTQNADYATVLEAQKAAINAAEDEAALAAAYAAAVLAMDALEIDQVELPEFAESYSYVAADELTGVAAGAAAPSTYYVTFTNCVSHNGSYVALKTDNKVEIKVAAGATLVVAMPYSSEVTLNGEAYTLVEDKLTYTAEADETVVITGKAGGAYIETITIIAGPKYAENYSYVFANEGTELAAGAAIPATDYVTFAGCQKHDGTYIALKNDNAVSINLAAGATVVVHMPYSSEITLNGEAYTLVEDKLTYTAGDTKETIVITGKAGGAYIQSITVTPAPKYAESYSYVFANEGTELAAGAAIPATDYVTFAGCQKHDGTYIALKNDNAVSINLAAGATVVVHMPYSSEITLNGEAYTLVEDKLTYTAGADKETIVITGKAGGAYIQSITVTPAPKYAANYSYVAADAIAADGDVVSNDYVTFTNCVAHNGSYVALKNDNKVEIRLAAGATVVVDMPYSSGVTLNGAEYTLVDNKLTYTATAEETIVITGAAGNAYIQSITVTTAE